MALDQMHVTITRTDVGCADFAKTTLETVDRSPNISVGFSLPARGCATTNEKGALSCYAFTPLNRGVTAPKVGIYSMTNHFFRSCYLNDRESNLQSVDIPDANLC